MGQVTEEVDWRTSCEHVEIEELVRGEAGDDMAAEDRLHVEVQARWQQVADAVYKLDGDLNDRSWDVGDLGGTLANLNAALIHLEDYTGC